jgi:hypothetical protein
MNERIDELIRAIVYNLDRIRALEAELFEEMNKPEPVNHEAVNPEDVNTPEEWTRAKLAAAKLSNILF